MPEPTDDDYFVKVDIGDGDNYEPTVTDAKQYGCTDPDNINYEQFKGSQDQCPKTSSTFTGEYDYTYQCPHSHCDTEIEIFKDNSGISQTSTITGLGYAASSADAESRLESYPPRWIPAPIDDMRDPDCELIQWIPDMNAPYLQHDHDLTNQELFEVFTHTSAINDPSRTHLRTCLRPCLRRVWTRRAPVPISAAREPRSVKKVCIFCRASAVFRRRLAERVE